MSVTAPRPLNSIIRDLYPVLPVLRQKQILAGFDGFIDTIARPVRKFDPMGKAEYFQTIQEFGAFITGHAHKSASIQYEVLQRKSGGNVPHFVAALQALSLPATVVGMFSDENGTIAPFFNTLGIRRYSYLEAGSATAFEFEDGKIFFSPLNIPAHNATIFSRIEQAFPEFRSALSQADLIAFLNWSELPFAHDLWNDIYVHGLSAAAQDANCFAFFDLCDTSAKTRHELEALRVLLQQIGGRRGTILSLNKNEALDINGKTGGGSASAAELAESLYAWFAPSELVIHQHNESIAVSAEGLVTEPCALNKMPTISTGAGDHFNAAYCFATLAELPPAEKLRFANGYASAYIAKGCSPGLEDVENR